MTAMPRFAELVRPARTRRLADDLLTALPLVAAAAVAAWRWLGPGAAAGVATVGLIVVALATRRRVRHLDAPWLVRQLDRRRDMDDSADLLLADASRLTTLQRLQRDRLARRLERDAPDLRAAWSTRRIALAWLAAGVVLAALVAVPHVRAVADRLAPSPEAPPAAPGIPHLVGQRLRIVPPAYTGLPARDEVGLDVRAPQGSRLEWTLAFAPPPARADLVVAGGGRIALARRGDRWTARSVLDRSLLYRVAPQVPAGEPLPRLHRLDAVPDAPPRVTVIAPDHSLSRVTPGQRRWPLIFAATDDYGVAGVAELHLTVAEGEGESVKFREQIVPVHGTGPATARRFSIAPDLAALKFVAGSDLVAQLVVHDNRTPGPQTARSPSLILRWPGATGEGVGMEGVVTRALPAYFRSERQVIIDAETLLKQRSRLPPAQFLAKSDGIGADQRLLRLRYGQFLGEEQEGKTAAPPTADAATPTPAPAVAEDGTVVKPAFGSETDTLADYGHVHDEAEAATLLDPETRTTLKGALDAMWQAELDLRQGAPAAALPFAYTALKLIKQVQQATRIFLARVGPDLPPIDATRRLTGKRDGLDHRDLPPVAATAIDRAPATAWRALAAPGGAGPAQLAALETWLRANRVADPLAFAAAIDAVRRDPACDACRRSLRGLLWGALPRPAPGVLRRDGGDVAGRRYLDALRAGGR